MQQPLVVSTKSNATKVLSQSDLQSRFWDDVLKFAESVQTSDIHIEQFGEGSHLKLVIRMRRYGELFVYKIEDRYQLIPGLMTRFKQVASLDSSTTSKAQDSAFTYDTTGARYRVSLGPAADGETVVMRVIRSGWLPKISELNLSKSAEQDLSEAIEHDKGLVLVTGPTGSGKSSTLQACLLQIDRKKWKVISIEDPVERQLEDVLHFPITPQFGWHDAIKMAMRQDPDYILIGEIRDPESAQLALEAAQTGHLVLSTLHTNDAAGVIDRLIGLGVDKQLLVDNLLYISAQRLEAKLCEYCRINRGDGYYMRHSPGCQQCLGGIKGVTPIIEYAYKPPRDAIINFDAAAFKANYLKQSLKSECERLSRLGMTDANRIFVYS